MKNFDKTNNDWNKIKLLNEASKNIHICDNCQKALEIYYRNNDYTTIKEEEDFEKKKIIHNNMNNLNISKQKRIFSMNDKFYEDVERNKKDLRDSTNYEMSNIQNIIDKKKENKPEKNRIIKSNEGKGKSDNYKYKKKENSVKKKDNGKIQKKDENIKVEKNNDGYLSDIYHNRDFNKGHKKDKKENIQCTYNKEKLKNRKYHDDNCKQVKKCKKTGMENNKTGNGNAPVGDDTVIYDQEEKTASSPKKNPSVISLKKIKETNTKNQKCSNETVENNIQNIGSSIYNHDKEEKEEKEENKKNNRDRKKGENENGTVKYTDFNLLQPYEESNSLYEINKLDEYRKEQAEKMYYDNGSENESTELVSIEDVGENNLNEKKKSVSAEKINDNLNGWNKNIKRKIFKGLIIAILLSLGVFTAGYLNRQYLEKMKFNTDYYIAKQELLLSLIQKNL